MSEVKEERKIRTVVLDPPWMERGGGKIKRGADRHYPIMTKERILETIVENSPWVGDEGQSIWMWTTANFISDALWLIKEMGGRYVTNAVWVKANPLDDGLVKPQAPGLGQRLRLCHEHLFCYFNFALQLSILS